VKYLLDTNVCIAMINGTSENVRSRFAQAARRGATFQVSSVVLYELSYGVAKSAYPTRNAKAVAAFLGGDIAVLDFSAQDAQAAGAIRVELERKGKPIGEYDTLIAGQSYSRDLVLVTANTREFNRVKGLVVEDWSA